MTTVIIILNSPIERWKGKNIRRIINPDITGLEIDSDHLKVRESNAAPYYAIHKSIIETMTFIFSKDK